MKKIFAMILALSLTVGMFTACGSETTEDTSQVVTSSMTEQEQKELLKENNTYAQVLFRAVDAFVADYAVIEIMYSPGTYKFTLAEASEAEGIEEPISDGTKKILTEEETLLDLKRIGWMTLSGAAKNPNGVMVIDIRSNVNDCDVVTNCYVSSTYYSDSETSDCAGAYGWGTPSSVPSFNINDIPDEYIKPKK